MKIPDFDLVMQQLGLFFAWFGATAIVVILPVSIILKCPTCIVLGIFSLRACRQWIEVLIISDCKLQGKPIPLFNQSEMKADLQFIAAFLFLIMLVIAITHIVYWLTGFSLYPTLVGFFF